MGLWGWTLTIIGAILVVVVFVVLPIKFCNTVLRKKEEIEKAKSRVRIAKAKYLQVLRKMGTTQQEAYDAHGGAYNKANSGRAGYFISGAIGNIESEFDKTQQVVLTLADDYQAAQQSLNELVNDYNVYITTFPRVIFAKLFRYQKEKYVDSANLDASTELRGFDDNDI